MNTIELRSLARKTKASLLVFCFILCSFPLATESCSPPIGDVPPDSVEKTIHYADAVVYGTVLRHFPHQFFQETFTAEMEIMCIFKGGPIPRFVNITNGGLVQGMCHSTELNVTNSYIVYLRKSPNGALEPSDQDVFVTGIADTFFNNVTRVCDLNTSYPTGVTESSARVQCPKTVQEPNCVRYGQDTGQTTDLPPLKEFTPPQTKDATSKDTKNTASGTDNLGQPENGATSSTYGASIVMTVLSVALILS